MAIVFSVLNNKGGTSKTTSVLNLGGAFQQLGKSVLLIDLDAQANLSIATGCGALSEHHVGKLLMEELSFEAVRQRMKTYDVLPSHQMLGRYESLIQEEKGGEFLLKEALEDHLEDYDIVLVDCPPTLGMLTDNSLVACDYFIVPLQAENFAYVGLDNVLQTAAKLRKRLNPTLSLAGVLLSRTDLRTRFGQSVYQRLRDDPNLKLFETHIRQDIQLMESTAFSQDIFEYAPSSRGAEDYLNLAKELMEHYGKA